MTLYMTLVLLFVIWNDWSRSATKKIYPIIVRKRKERQHPIRTRTTSNVINWRQAKRRIKMRATLLWFHLVISSFSKAKVFDDYCDSLTHSGRGCSRLSMIHFCSFPSTPKVSFPRFSFGANFHRCSADNSCHGSGDFHRTRRRPRCSTISPDGCQWFHRIWIVSQIFSLHTLESDRNVQLNRIHRQRIWNRRMVWRWTSDWRLPWHSNEYRWFFNWF